MSLPALSMGEWVPVAELFAWGVIVWEQLELSFMARCDRCDGAKFYELMHKGVEELRGFQYAIMLKLTFKEKTNVRTDERIIMCAKCGAIYCLKTCMFGINRTN